MSSTKKFNEIESQEKLRILENFVSNFYTTIRNQPNVLSSDEVYSLCDKIRLINKTIWSKVVFLEKDQRKNNPVVFGLKSGVVFKQYYMIFLKDYDIHFTAYIPEFFDDYIIEGNTLYKLGSEIKSQYNCNIVLEKDDMDILTLFFSAFENFIRNFDEEVEINIRKQNDELTNSKQNTLKDFDKDIDGIVDLVENDFKKLLSKNQKVILEIDKNYIHQFVKISNFINTKKQNTQKIFESISETSTHEELAERASLLNNQIYSYELIVFHSINMIGALVSEDLITFYEIYESFDKLGMYNSNWENEVSEKLTNIGDKLDDLLYSIYNMEQKIVSELNHLSYITQESFEDLNRSVTNQLREVESSINTNNLLSGIQAYQMYKINKKH